MQSSNKKVPVNSPDFTTEQHAMSGPEAKSPSQDPVKELHDLIATCPPEVQNYIKALESENLKLQQKIAALQSQYVSLQNRIKAEEQQRIHENSPEHTSELLETLSRKELEIIAQYAPIMEQAKTRLKTRQPQGQLTSRST